MAYNTKNILRSGDASPIPIPQFYNPTEDAFNPLTGANLGSGRYGTDGVMWGKTAGGVYIPVQVNANGEVLTQLSGRKVQVLKIFNAQEIRDTERYVSAIVDVSGFKDFDIMAISTNGTGINYDAYIYFPSNMHYWDKTASTWKDSKITGIATTQSPLPKSLRSALGYWPVGVSQVRVEIKYNTAPTTGSITVEVWGVPN